MITSYFQCRHSILPITSSSAGRRVQCSLGYRLIDIIRDCVPVEVCGRQILHNPHELEDPGPKRE